MKWNHRIVLEKGVYSIREVYYYRGKPTGWTNDPNELTGDSKEDLKEYYKQMAEAFKSPVIEVDGDGIM